MLIKSIGLCNIIELNAAPFDLSLMLILLVFALTLLYNAVKLLWNCSKMLISAMKLL